MSRSFPAIVSLNLISMVNNGFALLVSPMMLGLLIKSLIHKMDVSILLYTNIYLGIFCFSLVLFIDNVDILKGDYGLFIGKETLNCRIRGYLIFVFLSSLRNALVLQAIFRLCCIVYRSKVWLQKPLTYIIASLIIWIISFVLMIPVHVWDDIQLIPGDNVCFVATTSVRGIIWTTVSIYILPMSIINNIYMKVTRYLRKAPLMVSTNVKRDVIVIRRIVLVMLTLFVIGAPTIISILMLPFTKVGEPFFYRITIMTMALSMSTLSLILVYTSPQLKNIIIYSFKKNNQVAHFNMQNENKRIAAITKTNMSFNGVKAGI